MATETRYISVLDIEVGGPVWSNDANAIGNESDASYASATDFDLAGELAGGSYSDITNTPDTASTDLTEFYISHLDVGSTHSDDTYALQVNAEGTWETLETFNSGNLLPTSLSGGVDYTTAMQTKYGAAANKTTFLNGLQFRLNCTATSGGKDNVVWGVAWSKFTYNYTPPSSSSSSVSSSSSSVAGSSSSSSRSSSSRSSSSSSVSSSSRSSSSRSSSSSSSSSISSSSSSSSRSSSSVSSSSSSTSSSSSSCFTITLFTDAFIPEFGASSSSSKSSVSSSSSSVSSSRSSSSSSVSSSSRSSSSSSSSSVSSSSKSSSSSSRSSSSSSVSSSSRSSSSSSSSVSSSSRSSSSSSSSSRSSSSSSESSDSSASSSSTVWSTIYEIGLTSNATETGDVNFRAALTAAELNFDAEYLRFTFEANSGSDSTISGASIGVRNSTSPDYLSAPTRITFNGGSSSVTISAGTQEVSDTIAFSLDSDIGHLVHVYTESSQPNRYVADNGNYRTQNDVSDNTMVQDVTMAGLNFMTYLTKIEGVGVWSSSSNSSSSSS